MFEPARVRHSRSDPRPHGGVFAPTPIRARWTWVSGCCISRRSRRDAGAGGRCAARKSALLARPEHQELRRVGGQPAFNEAIERLVLGDEHEGAPHRPGAHRAGTRPDAARLRLGAELIRTASPELARAREHTHLGESLPRLLSGSGLRLEALPPISMRPPVGCSLAP